jgi:predicted RNA binding protein YcfA (HicA-like mRNA interferase family)
MPRLRVLSGSEVLKILREFGFQEYAQRGSHIKLRRVSQGGHKQGMTVPNHAEIDRGTLHAKLC